MFIDDYRVKTIKENLMVEAEELRFKAELGKYPDYNYIKDAVFVLSFLGIITPPYKIKIESILKEIDGLRQNPPR